jgi:hypothetical protein
MDERIRPICLPNVFADPMRYEGPLSEPYPAPEPLSTRKFIYCELCKRRREHIYCNIAPDGRDVRFGYICQTCYLCRDEKKVKVVMARL